MNPGTCHKREPEQVDHDDKVIADGILARAPMLLISKPDGIVANDRGSFTGHRVSPRPRPVPLAGAG
jgi:hypothetical protein